MLFVLTCLFNTKVKNTITASEVINTLYQGGQGLRELTNTVLMNVENLDIDGYFIVLVIRVIDNVEEKEPRRLPVAQKTTQT